MSGYEFAQLLVAAATLLLALFAGQVRGALWVLAIVLDLAMSTAWWVHDLPYGDVFTAGCDFAICILIYLFAGFRWELWLFRLYTASVLISLIDLAASIWAPVWIDHDTYSIGLEIINYSAFILIGGVSAFAFNSRFNVRAFDHWSGVLSARSLVRSVGGKARR